MSGRYTSKCHIVCYCLSGCIVAGGAGHEGRPHRLHFEGAGQVQGEVVGSEHLQLRLHTALTTSTSNPGSQGTDGLWVSPGSRRPRPLRGFREQRTRNCRKWKEVQLGGATSPELTSPRQLGGAEQSPHVAHPVQAGWARGWLPIKPGSLVGRRNIPQKIFVFMIAQCRPVCLVWLEPLQLGGHQLWRVGARHQLAQVAVVELEEGVVELCSPPAQHQPAVRLSRVMAYCNVAKLLKLRLRALDDKVMMGWWRVFVKVVLSCPTVTFLWTQNYQ